MSRQNTLATVVVLFLSGPVMADPPEVNGVTPEQGFVDEGTRVGVDG